MIIKILSQEFLRNYIKSIVIKNLIPILLIK